MGMAKIPGIPEALSKESALLSCEQCGAHKRVWLEKCEHCNRPETNWYENRIQELEGICQRKEDAMQKLYSQVLALEAGGATPKLKMKMEELEDELDMLKVKYRALEKIKSGEVEDAL